MAMNRKYAALPDLDSAPDIYETPELTDDNSTIPAGTVRSQSASSTSYPDLDDDEGRSSHPNISRSRLDPLEARALFSPARLDARGVDFSDRVSGKRKSYKASSRRRQLRDDGTTRQTARGDEGGDEESDDEDGEGLEARLARLRREVEEVRGELGQKKGAGFSGSRGNANEDEDDNGEDDDEVLELSRILDSLMSNRMGSGPESGARLADALSTPLPSSQKNHQPSAVATTASAADTSPSTYTVTYAPTFQTEHDLAKTADFDARLTELERSLGITSTTIPALDMNGIPMAVLPSLDQLQRQIRLLSDTTPASLDSMSQQVRTLTQEAQRLQDTRKAAKVALDELRASGEDLPPAAMAAVLASTAGTAAGNGGNNNGSNGGNGSGSGSGTIDADTYTLADPEQVAKINALYGTLPTIEKLAPLVPALLERLRSLRTIHAEAATAHDELETAFRQQADMAGEIRRWQQGLDKVEAAMRQGEATMGRNMAVVEGWVKELEAQVERLG